MRRDDGDVVGRWIDGQAAWHSVHTMLDVYAAWIEGAKDSDVEEIRQAMQSSVATNPRASASSVTNSIPVSPISPQNLALIWHWSASARG